MEELWDRLLRAVDASPSAVRSDVLAASIGVEHQALQAAVASLVAREMLVATVVERQQWALTEEGKQVAVDGSHEAKVYRAVVDAGSITQADLATKLGPTGGLVASVGVGKALKAGWITLEAGLLKPKATTITDETADLLRAIAAATGEPPVDANVLKDLKKRKLIQQVTHKAFELSKGPQFALTVTQQATDLTAEMIATGAWKTLSFKKYNLDAKGVPPVCGHLHPLLKVREEFRKIFFEMGFSEMPTNNFVESSFWNFDTLFQPQQHPSRDAHDTFFLSEPAATRTLPADYLQRVQAVHENGGFGSIGYRSPWKLEEAQKNILRTHTTAVSSRMLYRLAQEGFKPVKYFSIDRVFRNESLDATHLAEFHQVEGVIADYGLSLGDLIGVMQAFFTKLGIHQLRFKPAFNPYTEPSMEVFGFHDGLKRWIELGNSGVFRPEMLRPMGLPENVTVIAWGISLERPTMIKYKYNNIRDLCGHKVNLQMVHDNPMCRLDKN